MTPQPDATIVLLGIAALVGWGAGFGLAVVLFWRRITVPMRPDAWRRLQDQLDEANIIIGHLYQANERMAKRLVLGQLERRVDATTRQGAA